MIHRVRTWYERHDQSLRIRFPYFSVLRPLLVAPYLCCAWLIAAVSARFLRGTPQNPLDPEPLTVAWLMASILATTGWLWTQWRDRMAIHRHGKVPGAWSFLPTAGIVLLLMSPSGVWEWSAYRGVRSILSRENCGILLGAVQDRWALYNPDMFAWMEDEARADENGELWRKVADYRLCRILFSDSHSAYAEPLRQMLPPDLPDTLRPGCKTLLQAARKDDSKIPSGTLLHPYHIRRSTFENMLPSEHMCAAAYSEGLTPYWKTGSHQYWLLANALLVSAFLILRGTVPLARALFVAGGGAIGALAVFFFQASRIPESLFKSSSQPVHTAWLTWSLPLAWLMLLANFVQLSGRSRRSRRTDVTLIASWLAPIFVLEIEAALLSNPVYNLTDRFPPLTHMSARDLLRYDSSLPVALLTTCLLYLLSSLFTPFLFTRYRRLPYVE